MGHPEFGRLVMADAVCRFQSTSKIAVAGDAAGTGESGGGACGGRAGKRTRGPGDGGAGTDGRVGTWETTRCLQRKWSFYHGGVLLLLYADVLVLALVVFLMLYPYAKWMQGM